MTWSVFQISNIFCEPRNNKHLEQVRRAKFIAELQNILPLFSISLNTKIAHYVNVFL